MKLTKYKVKVRYLSYNKRFGDSCRIWRGDIAEKIPDPRNFFFWNAREFIVYIYIFLSTNDKIGQNK